MLAFFIFAIQFSSRSLANTPAMMRAQFFLVGRTSLPVGELRIGNEVGPIEHFRDEAAVQPIIGAGHVERPVGGLVDADRRRAVRRIPETARILAADQIRHAVEAGHRHRDVDQRDLDMLAAAEPVAGEQRQ